MRVTSVEIEGGRFAGRQTLRLGEVTALWGVNDAGKSTTLATLALLLGGGDAHAGRVCGILLEADADEAEELASRSVDALTEEGELRFELDGGQLNITAEDCSTFDREESGDTGAALRTWLDASLRAIGAADNEERRRLGEALSDARALYLVREEEDAYEEDAHAGVAWRAWWGLGLGAVEEDLRPLFRHLAPPWGSDSALAVVPAAIDAVWSTDWPDPVLVPVGWSTIERQLGNVGRALAELALAQAEEERLPHLAADEATERVLDSLASHAETHMPEFVRQSYRFSATSHTEPQVLVSRREDDETAFPVASLAEGYHLWVQLALVQVIDVAQRCVDRYPVLEEWEHVRAELGAVLTEAVDPDADEDQLDAFPREIERIGVELLAPSGNLERASIKQLVNLGRLFLVDEPEAHLHPAAQRQAARWLKAQDGRQVGRFVIASHSPAFLRLTGDTRLAHVSRSPNRHVQLRSVNPRRLKALDPEISELGFDRGELLAFHRAVLFVEGETDRRVLETLCEDRLAELGVLVLPFRGVKKGAADQLVNSETVMRVLGPPFYVMVDNCEPSLAARLQLMSVEDLESGLVTKQIDGQESRFLASLLIAARHAERENNVTPIPQKDILGVLDDSCIAAVLRRRTPEARPWPGFSELVEDHPGGYAKALPAYGITKDAGLFEEFAGEMRSRGLLATDLEWVLDRIERDVRAL
jgi:hypothetical protein